MAPLAADRPKGPQLRRILEELLAELGPNARLPSERVLAERHGVARMTVRAELDRLVREGSVERAHGRGTFVAPPRFPKTQRLLSFSAEMRQRGLVPGGRVLAMEVEPASPSLARDLDVEPGAPIVAIERLRTADGRPMALERACLAAARYPGLVDTDLTDRSLYELLAERWEAVAVHADQTVGAVLLTDDEAAQLAVEPPAPALVFVRTARDGSGRVVEHTRSLYRADRYEVAIEVTTSWPAATARTTPASPRPAARAIPNR